MPMRNLLEDKQEGADRAQHALLENDLIYFSCTAVKVHFVFFRSLLCLAFMLVQIY